MLDLIQVLQFDLPFLSRSLTENMLKPQKSLTSDSSGAAVGTVS